MDWNWYFAALAQSAAAIIGIFSAFIFTKIINNQTVFSQKKGELTSLLIESDRLKDLIEAINFEWYLKETQDIELDQISSSYDLVFKGLTPEECYNKLDFSPYDTRKDVIKLIDQRLMVKDSFKNAMNEEEYKNYSQIPTITIKPPYAAISKELSKIENTRILAVDHIRKINSFIVENNNNPESSGLITWVIGSMLFLFYATVIYPLSFLPMTQDPSISLSAFWDILFSLKGVLLGALGVTFTVIFVAFAWINQHMKYSVSEMSKLSDNTNLQDYSIYFDNYYDHNNE